MGIASSTKLRMNGTKVMCLVLGILFIAVLVSHSAPLGIMPENIAFNDYKSCEGCTCGLAKSSGYRSQETDVIPHPQKVLWDYVGLLVRTVRTMADIFYAIGFEREACWTAERWSKPCWE
jgi:hypothetical protein